MGVMAIGIVSIPVLIEDTLMYYCLNKNLRILHRTDKSEYECPGNRFMQLKTKQNKVRQNKTLIPHTQMLCSTYT